MQISDVSRFASVTQGFDALDLVEPEGDGLAAPRPISVLVIEDDDTDFHITQRTLLMMDTFDATIHHARSLEEARGSKSSFIFAEDRKKCRGVFVLLDF